MTTTRELNVLILEDLNAHDPSCESLEEFWFGKSGHSTYGGSIYECYRCDVTFFRTGLIRYITEEGEHGYCECCFRYVRPNVDFTR